MTAPRLFGSTFAGPSWSAWRACLRATFGLEMSEGDLAVYQRCTGRDQPPTKPAAELWCVAGRRSGKSRISALVAVYLAAFRTYALARGERGVVRVAAADRKQARVVFRYVQGLLRATPPLRALVARETADCIDLTNGVSIEVHACSYRSVRGYTVVGCVLDEVAY